MVQVSLRDACELFAMYVIYVTAVSFVTSEFCMMDMSLLGSYVFA